jgi:hypothetical protein
VKIEASSCLEDTSHLRQIRVKPSDELNRIVSLIGVLAFPCVLLPARSKGRIHINEVDLCIWESSQNVKGVAVQDGITWNLHAGQVT